MRKPDALAEHDFLFAEATERLTDRLDDIAREFPLALDLGARHGWMGAHRKIEHLIQADRCEAWMAKAGGNRIVCDEEWLPIAPASLDLVTSTLALHTVNDLPGSLIQIRQSLKPDGLLLAMMFGAHTLHELREALTAAEMELTGGITPRVAPFVDVRDAGNLLGRAGFALPVVDSETLSVSYEHMFALTADLRGMGEANVLSERAKHFTPRGLFARAAEIYHERYADKEGRITATFELITLTAWAPHESQQKPAKRGSGQVSLKDVL